jgi:hypothetical protein
MDAQTQRELTQREFARQSANFEKPSSLFRDVSILEWIAENVTVPPGARALDVAGGTDGGEASGLRAARGGDGALTITQRWMLAGG